MKILVLATDETWNELDTANSQVQWVRCESIESFLNNKQADAYFNLLHNASDTDYSQILKPVFINSVTVTLSERNASANVYRLNGWNGFMKRELWEVAGKLDDAGLHVLSSIHKKPMPVADEPGFISARIISMIINEAFFAKESSVSTTSEIDIAMKLGTNYPYGPFEWASKIGLINILGLLEKLTTGDDRYIPSKMLVQEAAASI